MSRQTKKKHINKDKIKINKLQNKIYDLEFLLKTKHNAYDDLLKENNELKKDLEFKEALIGVYEDGKKKLDKAIEIYKEKIRILERSLEISKINDKTWWHNYTILSKEKDKIISERDNYKEKYLDACDKLSEKIVILQKENENYKDQIENKDKTIERLKAQNYSLKKRSFLDRVFNT